MQCHFQEKFKTFLEELIDSLVFHADCLRSTLGWTALTECLYRVQFRSRGIGGWLKGCCAVIRRSCPPSLLSGYNGWWTMVITECLFVVVVVCLFVCFLLFCFVLFWFGFFFLKDYISKVILPPKVYLQRSLFRKFLSHLRLFRFFFIPKSHYYKTFRDYDPLEFKFKKKITNNKKLKN